MFTCLILNVMKQKITIKIIYAWALMLVFTSMLLLKDFHYHSTSSLSPEKASKSHVASVSKVCSICDFAMHKTTAAKATVFVPVVTITWVAKHIFTEQTVYQAIVSINSHSPPTVG